MTARNVKFAWSEVAEGMHDRADGTWDPMALKRCMESLRKLCERTTATDFALRITGLTREDCQRVWHRVSTLPDAPPPLRDEVSGLMRVSCELVCNGSLCLWCVRECVCFVCALFCR